MEMVQPTIAGEGDGLLLAEAGGDREREPAWRLNFDGLRRPEERKEKAPRGLQDCLGVLGTETMIVDGVERSYEDLLRDLEDEDMLDDT